MLLIVFFFFLFFPCVSMHVLTILDFELLPENLSQTTYPLTVFLLTCLSLLLLLVTSCGYVLIFLIMILISPAFFSLFFMTPPCTLPFPPLAHM